MCMSFFAITLWFNHLRPIILCHRSCIRHYHSPAIIILSLLFCRHTRFIVLCTFIIVFSLPCCHCFAVKRVLSCQCHNCSFIVHVSSCTCHHSCFVRHHVAAFIVVASFSCRHIRVFMPVSSCQCHHSCMCFHCSSAMAMISLPCHRSFTALRWSYNMASNEVKIQVPNFNDILCRC